MSKVGQPEAVSDGGAPDRVLRHRLLDRFYHWTMAASAVTLLATAFLPIVGLKFPWVAPHWIAGLVLMVVILFHIVRACFFQDIKAIGIGRRDVVNAWRSVKLALRRPTAEPGKAPKYPLTQRLYHHFVASSVLVTLGTGGLMMVRVNTPLWDRNPYWLVDRVWGIIYVLHGLAAMAVLGLVMVHIYFAIRPDKFWITRSMFVGWIKRKDYLEHHDPERWAPSTEGEPTKLVQSAASGDLQHASKEAGE